MAISNDVKDTYTWKRSIGKVHTDKNKRWFEEKDGVNVLVYKTQVWVDDIPETPPSATTSVIQVFDPLIMTEDITVNNHKSWLACFSVGDLTTRLHGFIRPSFGRGYAVVVYDNSGNIIPSTDASSWIFDYENGVLSFENDPTDYGWTLPIKIKVYQYIGQTVTGGGSGVPADLLEAPTLSGPTSIQEQDTAIYTITNYDSTCVYTVSFSSSLLTGSVSGNTITVNAGDITDGVDHTVDMTVYVSKTGYVTNQTITTITVIHLTYTADDSIYLENTSYIEDNIDVIGYGSLVP